SIVFAVTDSCSTDTARATFTVVPDTVAPIITVDAFIDSVCNGNPPDTLWASWTDECGDSGELFALPVLSSAPDCEDVYAYTFYAEDNCENSSDTTIYVTRYYDQVGGCETMFGRLDDDTKAICFLDDDMFNRWGWTNQITERGVTYTMNMYAGAAHCDITNREPVGTVQVTWQGDSVHVVYEMNPGQYLDEIHVYVGEDQFPTLNKGKKPKRTVAPGQYTIKDEDLIVNNGADFWIHDVNYEDFFWIIAHGVVCELTCNCSAPYPEFGGPEIQTAYAKPASVKKSVDILLGVDPVLQDSELKVFPNPFDEVVNFEFVPAVSGHAVLEIHNMLGQRVVRLLDQPVEAGELQRVEFRPDSEISGVYLYRLDIDGDVRIGKLIYRNR
ncbi:T9SS type A sorting domain-containing protein, partial [Draconibacterium sp. IB214405]|uniref:T9SS type A sorting domain-containing protein n=1 Tax=Draconibacterium sp. IB214405 TaxID=3097352 RepID=UPI002A0AF25D